MKTRFPLYAKILLWFFLNVLLLALAGVVFFAAQFRVGPEFLLTGPGGDRLRAMGEVIGGELSAMPRENWDAVLGRFARAYQMKMAAYRMDGAFEAGEHMELPEPVLSRLRPMAPVWREPGSGPRRRERLRDGREDGEPPQNRLPPNGSGPEAQPGRPDQPAALVRGEFNAPPGGEERPFQPPRGENLEPRPPAPLRPPFLVRTGNPVRYWIGVTVPMQNHMMDRPGAPITVLMVSESLGAGGLLIDVKTWAWVAAAVVGFSLLFWLPLVRSITRSVSQMHVATGQIAEGKFEVRVRDQRRDELGSLGAAINRMARRLSGFVSGQKRFLGDIAHELCSPIARMQMAVGILEERASAKDKPYVDDLREEIQEMSALVNELLSFSKASLGASAAKIELLELRPLVERALKRESRDGAQMENAVPGGLAARADAELLMRAISNLLRNAVRYAGGAGPITVSARAVEGGVEITVGDCGPGVPEAELPKLFDPFYRVDVSRTRETGGAGLGLSIVKTCIESCGGTVSCHNRETGGFEAVMRLTAGS
jgi:two-component system sensor histidine kinase CpxA